MKISLSPISSKQSTQETTTTASRTARLLTQDSITTTTMIFLVRLLLLSKLSPCEDQSADDKYDEQSYRYEFVMG